MRRTIRNPLACIPLIVLCATAYGDVITSNASCSAGDATALPTSQTQTGTSSCLVSYPAGPHSAGSHAIVNISVGAFDVSISASALGGGYLTESGISGSNSALAAGTASYEAPILPDGPVRAGFVVLSFSEISNAVSGGPQVTGEFGPYSFNRGNGLCFSSFGFNACNGAPITVAITLGIPIDVSISANAGVSANGDFSDAAVSGHLSFSFFEEDGTTPVGFTDPSAVPEPQGAWLSALGVALIGFRLKRKA
jgi:hypothetical protein